MPANLSATHEEEIVREYSNATAASHEDGGNGRIFRRAGGTSTMGTCPAYFLDMSGYSSTTIGTFFDVKPADQLNAILGTYNPWPPNINVDGSGNPILTSAETSGAIFAREHVYEVSMGAFLSSWLITLGYSLEINGFLSCAVR